LKSGSDVSSSQLPSKVVEQASRFDDNQLPRAWPTCPHLWEKGQKIDKKSSKYELKRRPHDPLFFLGNTLRDYPDSPSWVGHPLVLVTFFILPQTILFGTHGLQ